MAAHLNASRDQLIGITQRVSPLAVPWKASLRERYTDFQVNEIRRDGSVLHLKEDRVVDISKPPSEPKPEPKPEEPAAETQPADGTGPLISIEDQKTLEDLVGEAFTSELITLYGRSFDRKAAGDGKAVANQVTSDPIDDRIKRTQIHHDVRRIFNSSIETTTKPTGAVVATLASKKGGRNSRKPPKPDCQGTGEYLHFTLYKENRDTIEAVSIIARMLNVKPQVIQFAGTKDRRAVTVQRCSVRRRRAAELAALNKKLFGIRVGDFEYKPNSVWLGQLKGNSFTIVLKDCEFDGSQDLSPKEVLSSLQTTVKETLDHMTKHGWINYFGHQRFGSNSIGTHDIGMSILTGDFEGAVDKILGVSERLGPTSANVQPNAAPRDDDKRTTACRLFKDGKDPKGALEILPRRFSAEYTVIQHLASRQGRDFCGAITRINRGLRTMYLHAYQSYVWNHAASERWARYGNTVVKGDLILVDVPNKPADDDTLEPEGHRNGEENDENDDSTLPARALTAEEAASGKYTIHDIVLPTPGYEVLLPDNDIGTFYETFMARPENGALDPHKMRRPQKEFNLPGRYRKLMTRFLGDQEPSIEVKLYADNTDQLCPTDADRLKQRDGANGANGAKTKRAREDDGAADSRPAKKPAQEVADSNKESVPEQGPTETLPVATTVAEAAPPPEPSRVAVILSFQLAKSAYATVALRELMGAAEES